MGGIWRLTAQVWAEPFWLKQSPLELVFLQAKGRSIGILFSPLFGQITENSPLTSCECLFSGDAKQECYRILFSILWLWILGLSESKPYAFKGFLWMCVGLYPILLKAGVKEKQPVMAGQKGMDKHEIIYLTGRSEHKSPLTWDQSPYCVHGGSYSQQWESALIHWHL